MGNDEATRKDGPVAGGARAAGAPDASAVDAAPAAPAPLDPTVADLPPGGTTLRRWGPASWWRLGLVALLGLLVALVLMGGGFWSAAPVEAPR